MTRDPERTLGDTAAPGAEDPTGILAPGTIVGRYVLLGQVGRGAMGVVYVAYDPELHRNVALKLLRTRVDQAATRVRLLREAQAMARLRHPCVVTVHDAGTFGDQVFVAMEFVDGETLGARLRRARGWRDVLRLFVAAGRGLAAAHASGLVHRDFKPDNVLVDRDDHVYVTDFGLARPDARAGDEGRAMPDEPLTPYPLPTELEALSSAGAQATRYDDATSSARFLGTPAYMAPEVWLGHLADSRSDQFSYCVALYEAVYGERPFAGDTLAALTAAVTEGRLREAPPSANVPGWLRRALQRGLAVDPERRWPTLAPLLDLLEHTPQRRRIVVRRTVLAGAMLTVAGAWAATAWQGVRVCEGGADRVATVWGTVQRDAVRTSFAATGARWAAKSLDTVEHLLDERAQAWASVHRRVCLEHRRGEQSDRALDLRMACLNDSLGELRLRVATLAEADATIVEHAVGLAASLAPLQRCEDTALLQAPDAAPLDESARARAATLREALERARSLAAAGATSRAQDAVAPLPAQARALGDPTLLAETLLAEGEIASAAGDAERAWGSLRESYWGALAARDDTTALAAALATAEHLVSVAARYDDAEQWAGHAGALARRGTAAGSSEANLENVLGTIAFRRGNHAGARDHYQRELALLRGPEAGSGPRIAAALNNVGNVAEAEGDYAAAEALHREALALKEELLGGEHPDVAASLQNLGNLAYRRGDMPAARRLQESALAILRARGGDDDGSVASLLTNLGAIAEREGHWESAREAHERAVAIFERVLGPAHPNTAVALTNLGVVLGRLGRHREALQLHDRAHQIFATALGVDHPYLGYPLTGMGRAHLELGDAATGLPLLERAWALRATGEPDATVQADTRFALARALRATSRDPQVAAEHARAASAAFAAAGPAFAAEAAAVEAWLSASP